jgi:hypothetical protein
MYKVESLSDAPLTTDHREIICMMIAPPFSQHNLLVAGKNGSLNTVLTPSGCYLTTYTHPAEAYLTKFANEIEGELLFLGHQLAGN